VIAHRLNTIRNADNILLIKNGSIAEQGKHDELMKQGGLYKSMVEKQGL
jgi:ATP-binding cassette subfamily B protein